MYFRKNTILIPEQFNVKAHPALFEGEEREAKKIEEHLYSSLQYVGMHIQNQIFKSNTSKTVRDGKCQWKLDSKSFMGFRMVKIFSTSGDL